MDWGAIAREIDVTAPAQSSSDLRGHFQPPTLRHIGLCQLPRLFLLQLARKQRQRTSLPVQMSATHAFKSAAQ
jgi:hypothetical protein